MPLTLQGSYLTCVTMYYSICRLYITSNTLYGYIQIILGTAQRAYDDVPTRHGSVKAHVTALGSLISPRSTLTIRYVIGITTCKQVEAKLQCICHFNSPITYEEGTECGHNHRTALNGCQIYDLCTDKMRFL